jgi:hypothetical protein
MGTFEWNKSLKILQTYAPQPQMSSVPNNVVILIESLKPNYDIGDYPSSTPPGTPTGYKDYFGNDNGGGWTDVINNSANGVDRIGTPHSKSTMCNMLCADGHISLVNPFTEVSIYPPVNGVPQPLPTPLTTPGCPYKYPSTAVFANWMIGPGPHTPTSATVTSLAPKYSVPNWNAYAPELP